jgi:N-methylhydantoinase B
MGEIDLVTAKGRRPEVPIYGLERTGPSTLRILSPGGGGAGNSMQRPAEKVLNDVRGGIVSADAARRDYGVVLTPDGRDVDQTATRALRDCAKTLAQQGSDEPSSGRGGVG